MDEEESVPAMPPPRGAPRRRSAMAEQGARRQRRRARGGAEAEAEAEAAPAKRARVLSSVVTLRDAEAEARNAAAQAEAERHLRERIQPPAGASAAERARFAETLIRYLSPHVAKNCDEGRVLDGYKFVERYLNLHGGYPLLLQQRESGELEPQPRFGRDAPGWEPSAAAWERQMAWRRPAAGAGAGAVVLQIPYRVQCASPRCAAEEALPWAFARDPQTGLAYCGEGCRLATRRLAAHAALLNATRVERHNAGVAREARSWAGTVVGRALLAADRSDRNAQRLGRVLRGGGGLRVYVDDEEVRDAADFEQRVYGWRADDAERSGRAALQRRLAAAPGAAFPRSRHGVPLLPADFDYGSVLRALPCYTAVEGDLSYGVALRAKSPHMTYHMLLHVVTAAAADDEGARARADRSVGEMARSLAHEAAVDAEDREELFQELVLLCAVRAALAAPPRLLTLTVVTPDGKALRMPVRD